MDLPGATTGAEEHLTFVEHLVSKYQFPGDKLSILDQEIADVRERCNDPNLYMVVIGEASSGKSTFINALIEAPLLKTDSIFETTAAATVLSYGETLRASIRLRSPVAQHHGKGAAPHLEFIAPDDAAEASQIYTFSKEDEPIHFGNGQNATPMSLEDLIRMVATEPALARQVISMHVNYPAHFLADNICIIDTPGLNAQIADLNPKQVTQQAVAHADGAIILTRANQALSHSLITLLHRDLALGEHIRRCAFLITKMDEIEDEHDHHRIMQRVHAVVRREFIPNGTLPPIFCGAPKLALDAAINGGPANPQIAHWQSQFATLKEHLVAYLQRQRATVIVEKTLRLLNDLFTT
ncbi:MAG: hypothetical protein EOM24_32265, partial [Chloroflexia bacterium]|nr:hypothetical protein [Chloroflexia bacterium]